MCIVCKHNQIKDIDRALLTGATLSSLTKQYGFSTSGPATPPRTLAAKNGLGPKTVSCWSTPGLVLQAQYRHGTGPECRPGRQGRRGFQIVPPGQPGIHPDYQPDEQNGGASGTGNDLLSHGFSPVGPPGQPPAQCLPGPVRNPPDPES